MPEGRFAGIVILAEDRMHVRFIRSWLRLRVNVSQRDIRDRLPDGGAGEQFVREQFKVEAEAQRLNAARRGSMLIAVIDADTGDAQAHYRELAGNTPPEGVFIFVPKRSIETWLHQLNDLPANEEKSYKQDYRKDASEAIRVAGEAFLDRVQRQSVEALLPSLARGVEEARRIPRLHETTR